MLTAEYIYIYIYIQLTPDKADIYIAAPRFKDIVDKQEAVYGTPYKLKMVDAGTTIVAVCCSVLQGVAGCCRVL